MFQPAPVYAPQGGGYGNSYNSQQANGLQGILPVLIQKKVNEVPLASTAVLADVITEVNGLKVSLASTQKGATLGALVSGSMGGNSGNSTLLLALALSGSL